MKNILKKIIMLFMSLIGKINNNKIIFINFNGKGYGCNPKYIAEELHKRNKKYNLIWAVRDMDDKTVPSYIKKVKINRLRFFYDMATAKIWISNVRLPEYIHKKKNQFYIQTWHGGVALKKIEAAVADKLSKEYVKSAKKDSVMTDLMLSNSSFCTKMYKSDFWYNGDILECGSPRNDLFFRKNINNIKKNIFNKYNVSKNKKVILYAPTFRNSDEYNYFSLDFKKLISKLNDDYVVFVRLHPNVQNNNYEFNSSIINVSDYGDIQELLIITDILITDYSSVMFEYLNIGNQIYLYVPDLNDYIDERGFYFSYKDLPFPILCSSDELIKSIKDNKYKDYTNAKKKFIKELNLMDDGCASSRVCDIIEKKIKEG